MSTRRHVVSGFNLHGEIYNVQKINPWRKEEKNIIGVKTSGFLTLCNVIG